MTMAESAQTYDSAKGPTKEAAADAASIRTVLEKDGADAAVTRLRSEVESVPERDRQAYNTALFKGLTGDSNKMPNILPDMAIAFGMQNSGSFLEQNRWKWNDSERIVNPDKLTSAASKETNPIYQELYREMYNKFRSLKSENSGNFNPLYAYAQGDRFVRDYVVPEGQLKEQLATDLVRADNRRQFGVLASNSKLFDAIASGGEITQDSLKTFSDRWNQTGTSGADFRKQYASTPEQQRQIGQTLDNLKYAFDDSRHKDNKPGSVLQDNKAGFMARNVTDYFHDYGKMTRDSLLSGLGYKSMDEAKLRLPADVGGKPLADVVPLSSYDNTKLLNRQDGPMGIARRMLSGQDKFFKDAPGGMEKAVTDLTKVLSPSTDGTFVDKAVNQVTPENRDKVIQNIAATGNDTLRDWFVSRYPADMSAVEASTTAAGPLDNSSSKVVSKQGPDAVATNMLKDAGLDASAMKALSSVLYKDLGVNWKSVRSGTPLITNENLEDVRAKIAAKGNDKLIQWFDSKYPKRS
jgi:hypothetical protein